MRNSSPWWQFFGSGPSGSVWHWSDCLGSVFNKPGGVGGANCDSGTNKHVRAIVGRLRLQPLPLPVHVERFKLLKYDDSCLPLPGGIELELERGVDAATESMLAAALLCS